MAGTMTDIVLIGERDGTALAALQQAGFRVQSLGLEAAPVEARLAVIDSRGGLTAAQAFAQAWRETRGGPMIWLAEALDPASRLAGWQAEADAVLVLPFASGELPLLVTRLLLQSEDQSRLRVRAEETAQINQNLIQLYRQIDADFRIARKIQRSCRPAHLPDVGLARFAVWHRERLGSAGDFYHVVRVDECRVAFLLGDVLGQSLTSCMLAVFVHQNVQPKAISGQSYRIIPPDEVLHRLDRQIASLGVPDPPMIRLTYVVLDAFSGEMSLSCAGHTPPLLLSAKEAEPRFLRLPGPMLGTGDARFPVDRHRLEPGDRLLLFTDGLHGTAPHQLDHFAQTASKYRDQPLPLHLEHLTNDLIAATPDPDDFTVLGVEFQANRGDRPEL